MAILDSDYTKVRAKDINDTFGLFNNIIEWSGITPDENKSPGEVVIDAMLALRGGNRYISPVAIPRETANIIIDNGSSEDIDMDTTFEVLIQENDESMNTDGAKVILNGHTYNVITNGYDDLFNLPKPSKVFFKKVGSNTLKVISRTFNSSEFIPTNLADFPDKMLCIGEDNVWVSYPELVPMFRLPIIGNPIPHSSGNYDYYASDAYLPNYITTVDISLPNIIETHPLTNLKMSLDVNIMYRSRIISDSRVVKDRETYSGIPYKINPYVMKDAMAKVELKLDYTDFYNDNSQEINTEIDIKTNSMLQGFEHKITFTKVGRYVTLKLHLFPMKGRAAADASEYLEPYIVSINNIGSTIHIMNGEMFSVTKEEYGFSAGDSTIAKLREVDKFRLPGSYIEDLSKIDEIGVDTTDMLGMTQRSGNGEVLQITGDKNIYFKTTNDGGLNIAKGSSSSQISLNNINSISLNYTDLPQLPPHYYNKLMGDYLHINNSTLSQLAAKNELTDIIQGYWNSMFAQKYMQRDVEGIPITTPTKAIHMTSYPTSHYDSYPNNSVRHGDLTSMFAVGDEGLSEEYKNAPKGDVNLAELKYGNYGGFIYNYIYRPGVGISNPDENRRMSGATHFLRMRYPRNIGTSSILNTYYSEPPAGSGGPYNEIKLGADGKYNYFNGRIYSQEPYETVFTNIYTWSPFYKNIETRDPKPIDANTSSYLHYDHTNKVPVVRFIDGNPNNNIQRYASMTFLPKVAICVDLAPAVKPTDIGKAKHDPILFMVDGNGDIGVNFTSMYTSTKRRFNKGLERPIEIHSLTNHYIKEAGKNHVSIIVIEDYLVHIFKKSNSSTHPDGTSDSNCTIMNKNHTNLKMYSYVDTEYDSTITAPDGDRPNARVCGITSSPANDMLMIIKTSDANELSLITYGEKDTNTYLAYAGEIPDSIIPDSGSSIVINPAHTSKVGNPDYDIIVRPSYINIDIGIKKTYTTYIYVSGVGIFAYGVAHNAEDGTHTILNDLGGPYAGFEKLTESIVASKYSATDIVGASENFTFNKEKIVFLHSNIPALYIDNGKVYYKLGNTYQPIRGLPPIKKFIRVTGGTHSMDIVDGMLVEDYNSRYFLLDAFRIHNCLYNIIGNSTMKVANTSYEQPIRAREIKVPSGEEIVRCKGMVMRETNSISLAIFTSKGHSWSAEAPLNNLSNLCFVPTRSI